MHTNGAANPAGLLIYNKCLVKDKRFGCFDPWGYRDVPKPEIDPGEFDVYRVFVVDSVFQGGSAVGVGAIDRAAFVNCRYENIGVLIGPGNEERLLAPRAAAGRSGVTFINCSWEFDVTSSVQRTPRTSQCLDQTTTAEADHTSLDMIHCSFSIVGSHNRQFRFTTHTSEITSSSAAGHASSTRSREIRRCFTAPSPSTASVAFAHDQHPQRRESRTALRTARRSPRTRQRQVLRIRQRRNRLPHTTRQRPGSTPITRIGSLQSRNNQPAIPIEHDQNWNPIGQSPASVMFSTSGA